MLLPSEQEQIDITLKQQPEPEVNLDKPIDSVYQEEMRVFYWHKWYLRFLRELAR